MNKNLLRYGMTAVLTLLIYISMANGQEFSGTISGTVNDQNGAVVPAVTVTVQNIETMFRRRRRPTKKDLLRFLFYCRENINLRRRPRISKLTFGKISSLMLTTA